MIPLRRAALARLLARAPASLAGQLRPRLAPGVEVVEVTPEEFRQLVSRRAPRGLGDWVAGLATPIARALRLPCIDPATNQLRPESGCAKRQAALNKAFPSA